MKLKEVGRIMGNADADPTARKAAAELGKIELETRLLERQLSPSAQRVERIKAYAGLGGVLAGLAALLSLTVTASLGIMERGEARRSKLEERLDQAIMRAASKDAGLQLSGVAALRIFLTAPDSDSATRLQILSSLAKLLAVEEKPVVRSALVDSFASIPQNDSRALEVALGSLVESSRAIVAEANLAAEPPILRPAGPAEERAYSVGQAIAQIVRLGARPADLSGIYCAECDFSGRSLAGYRFAAAILPRADFSGAMLEGVAFDGAELDGARFVAARLGRATFVTKPERRAGTYLWRRLRAFAQAREGKVIPEGPGDTKKFDPANYFWASGPDFSCADLSGARFEGFPLFRVQSLEARVLGGLIMRGEGTKFRGARLEGTDFSGIRYYGTYLESEYPPLLNLRTPGEGKILFYEGDSLDPDRIADTGSFRANLVEIRSAFLGSNWRQAKLPEGLLALLKSQGPAAIARTATSVGCTAPTG
jgi:uncharacterized protein YjbI with pentapeptide repeats